MKNEKPSVTVYKSCECGVCVSGARWFMCPFISTRFVAEYECDPKYVDSRDIPSDEHVQYIGQNHKGCVLVYMDG
jgi:hypothetical protein